MHPTISYHLATARAAELRSQAQRDALARAARHARTHKLEHAAPRLAAAGRRLLTSLTWVPLAGERKTPIHLVAERALAAAESRSSSTILDRAGDRELIARRGQLVPGQQ
jgi:hypothetical protein